MFHAQQAVEKALKAFLALHDTPFRKTHDLVELGRQCVSIDAGLESQLRAAAPLTEYAWRYRYPGDLVEPEVGEAERAVPLAQKVVALIEVRLDAARG